MSLSTRERAHPLSAATRVGAHALTSPGGHRPHSYSPHFRTCPTCKGTGINPMLPMNVCPKCKGETVVRRWSW